MQSSMAEISQEQRHERLLKQWAAKVINILPANDDDARKVLEYATRLLEGFLAIDAPSNVSARACDQCRVALRKASH